MAPLLYMIQSSPPTRAVMMTAKSIGLDLNLKEIFFRKGEHKTPEFLKMNPQHTVPTLVDDDGFTLWDSHAIMIYFMEKYSTDDALYPKDLKQRAIIHQRFHFDSAALWPVALQIIKDIIYKNAKTVHQDHVDAMNEAYGFLNTFLENSQWVAGNSVTLADYSLVASVSAANLLVKIDSEKYPNIISWLNRAKEWPVHYINEEGIKILGAYLKPYLSN